MPIDRTDEHKTNVRLPKATADRLSKIHQLTGISQNDLIAAAVQFLCDLSENSLHSARLPRAVVAARAVISHEKHPMQVDFTDTGPALAAEDTPKPVRKHAAK